MRKNGKFILDVKNRENALKNYEFESSYTDEGGVVHVEEKEFDIITSRNQSRVYALFPDGTRKDFGGWTSLRFYTVTELIEMFHLAGFKDIKVYGDYDHSDLTIDSPRCILIGNK